MLPPFDPVTGRLPDGEHEAAWQEVVERFGWNPRRRQLLDGPADAIELLAAAGCAAQKARFGGELMPNVTEAGSGLTFAEFFRNERDTGRKGIVVLRTGGQT